MLDGSFRFILILLFSAWPPLTSLHLFSSSSASNNRFPQNRRHCFFSVPKKTTTERVQPPQKDNRSRPIPLTSGHEGAPWRHEHPQPEGMGCGGGDRQPVSRPKTNERDVWLDQKHRSRREWLLELAADKDNKDGHTVSCYRVCQKTALCRCQ